MNFHSRLSSVYAATLVWTIFLFRHLKVTNFLLWLAGAIEYLSAQFKADNTDLNAVKKLSVNFRLNYSLYLTSCVLYIRQEAAAVFRSSKDDKQVWKNIKANLRDIFLRIFCCHLQFLITCIVISFVALIYFSAAHGDYWFDIPGDNELESRRQSR